MPYWRACSARQPAWRRAKFTNCVRSGSISPVSSSMRLSAVSTYWRPAADSSQKRIAAGTDSSAVIGGQPWWNNWHGCASGPALVHQRAIQGQSADLHHMCGGIHDSGTGPPTASCAAAAHQRGRSWPASWTPQRGDLAGSPKCTPTQQPAPRSHTAIRCSPPARTPHPRPAVLDQPPPQRHAGRRRI